MWRPYYLNILGPLQMFGSTADVRTSGWVKPASDTVVTYHSNFSILLGGDLFHNTAITTWKPEAWAGVFFRSREQLHRETNGCNKLLPAQVNVIIGAQTCGRRRAPASDFTHHAPYVTGSCDFASLYAQRWCIRRPCLNEASLSYVGCMLSQWVVLTDSTHSKR